MKTDEELNKKRTERLAKLLVGKIDSGTYSKILGIILEEKQEAREEVLKKIESFEILDVISDILEKGDIFIKRKDWKELKKEGR